MLQSDKVAIDGERTKVSDQPTARQLVSSEPNEAQSQKACGGRRGGEEGSGGGGGNRTRAFDWSHSKKKKKGCACDIPKRMVETLLRSL